MICDYKSGTPFQGRPGERGAKGQPGEQGTPVSLSCLVADYTDTPHCAFTSHD